MKKFHAFQMCQKHSWGHFKTFLTGDSPLGFFRSCTLGVGEIRNNRTSFIVIMTGLIESLGLPGHYVKRGRFVIFSAKIQMIAFLSILSLHKKVIYGLYGECYSNRLLLTFFAVFE